MKLLVGLLVCVAVAAVSILLLVGGTVDLSGCDAPDVEASVPTEGLGSPQSSSVEDFPVPDLAVENDCAETDDLDSTVFDFVEYRLPPSATSDVVIAWYLEQGIAGQPYSTFEWCGATEGRLEWIERSDPPRYLDVRIITDDDATSVNVSIAPEPVGASDGPLCP